MAYIAALLLSLGLVALTIELFMPGFGVFGVSGFIMLAVSAVLTVIFIPNGIFIVAGGFAIILVIGYLLVDHLRKNGLYKSIILSDTLDEDKNNTELLSGFINKEGVAKTPLKPCGNVVIEGVTLEAYSDGDFIVAKDKIKAVKVSDNKLYVKKI